LKDVRTTRQHNKTITIYTSSLNNVQLGPHTLRLLTLVKDACSKIMNANFGDYEEVF